MHQRLADGDNVFATAVEPSPCKAQYLVPLYQTSEPVHRREPVLNHPIKRWSARQSRCCTIPKCTVSGKLAKRNIYSHGNKILCVLHNSSNLIGCAQVFFSELFWIFRVIFLNRLYMEVILSDNFSKFV